MRTYATDADPLLLTALGTATANFSALERSLETAIALMLLPAQRDIAGDIDFSVRAQIVTAEMSYRQLISAFASLFRHLFPNAVDGDFDDICRSLHNVGNRRNQLIHSSYVLDATAGQVVRQKVTAKNVGLRTRVEVLSSNDILEFANSLPTLAQRIHYIVLEQLLSPELRSVLHSVQE